MDALTEKLNKSIENIRSCFAVAQATAKNEFSVVEENIKLKAELVEAQEAEGAVCPEDVGFAEYIKVLNAELAKSKEENKRLREKQFAPPQ